MWRRLSPGDRPVLLFVDDEPRILSALRRSLRREGYEILTAERPDEALRLLDERPVDVVISDHKMPTMTGLDFLARAALRCPGASRMLLTGWPEEVPADERQRLGVCALLPKPWQEEDLKSALRAAVEAEPPTAIAAPSAPSAHPAQSDFP